MLYSGLTYDDLWANLGSMRRGREYTNLRRLLRPARTDGAKTMKLRLLAVLLTVPLWACANSPNSGADAAADNATTALRVIETPLFLAFKVPVCLGSVPLLVPAAAASVAVPFQNGSHEKSGWAYYKNGVKEACGPPYAARPWE